MVAEAGSLIGTGAGEDVVGFLCERVAEGDFLSAKGGAGGRRGFLVERWCNLHKGLSACPERYLTRGVEVWLGAWGGS